MSKKLLWPILLLVLVVFIILKYQVGFVKEDKTFTLPTGSGTQKTIFNCDDTTALTLEESWPKQKGSFAEVVLSDGQKIYLTAMDDPTNEVIYYRSDNGEEFVRTPKSLSINKGKSTLLKCVSAKSI